MDASPVSPATQADPTAVEGVLSVSKAMRVSNANLARIADAELIQVGKALLHRWSQA